MSQLTGLRVVLVDDHEDSLCALQALLQLDGAEVVTATNAVDAVDHVINEAPHVLVSDIAMPRRDGLWLLAELHSRGVGVPAIAITGQAKPEAVLRAGYKVYLRKPIDPDELCRTVAQVAAGRV